MGWRQGVAYGQDLRDRVLAARDAGQSVRAVAERFSVSPSHVAKADGRWRRTGERRARRSSGRPPAKILVHLPALAERITVQPDATLAELRGWLLAERGAAVGLVTVWRALKRFGVTLKKSKSGRPSRTIRTLPKHARLGGRCSAVSARPDGCSSTKLLPPPT